MYIFMCLQQAVISPQTRALNIFLSERKFTKAKIELFTVIFVRNAFFPVTN